MTILIVRLLSVCLILRRLALVISSITLLLLWLLAGAIVAVTLALILAVIIVARHGDFDLWRAAQE